MRKPFFCICENKDADQLQADQLHADQRLCFRYIDSTISLLHINPKVQASNYQPVLCSNPPKTSFLTSRLICSDAIKCG